MPIESEKRHEHRRGRHLREVGPEQEPKPFLAAGHQQRVDRQCDQDDEQQGHQHLCRAFDAFLHARRDDEVRGQHEQRGVEHGPPRVLDEILENALVFVGGGVPGEASRHGVSHVFGGPSRHHEVEAQDQECRHDAVVAQETPLGVERPVGSHGIAVRGASDREFGHHDGQSQQQDAENVNYQKSSAAVVSGDIGEPPDISQPHGTSGRDEHGAQFAAQRCAAV